MKKRELIAAMTVMNNRIGDLVEDNCQIKGRVTFLEQENARGAKHLARMERLADPYPFTCDCPECRPWLYGPHPAMHGGSV